MFACIFREFIIKQGWFECSPTFLLFLSGIQTTTTSFVVTGLRGLFIGGFGRQLLEFTAFFAAY